MIGVYDDHDYGVNDGCKNYPKRKESKKCLMDFLDVPKNSPLRKQEGAYQSYTFGKGAQTIKVIVMDTRYFRDPVMPIATPMSARRKAGASFTPSPVIETICPRSCKALTIFNLCSGDTRAKTCTSSTTFFNSYF